MENIQQTQDHKDPSLPWKLISRTMFALLGAAIAPSMIALVIGSIGLIPVLLNGGKIQPSGNWMPFIAVTAIIFIVSFVHVLILGAPAVIIGCYFKSIRWWTSIVVSFIVGALPTAIFLWPLKYPQLQTTSSRWDGEKMIQTMIKGVPTVTGWTDWISALLSMGLFGVSGGMTFWLIWRQRNKPLSSRDKSLYKTIVESIDQKDAL